ncbi:unnamed protein product [Closterium sp. Naga37s-1]|nr:unnamed protein product [Closterium sp. Naga37s-1]
MDDEIQPISLVYNDWNPHWSQTVRFFLTRPDLHSLHLRFSRPDHLPTLGACIARSSPSLSSLHLEMQGTVGSSARAGGAAVQQERVAALKALRELLSANHSPPLGTAVRCGAVPLLAECLAFGAPEEQAQCLAFGAPEEQVGLSGEGESWPLSFLKDCAQLQELNLGRGMWKLNWQCVNTSWFKSIRKLTLEHVHYGSMSFQFIEIITQQLHEFTLYEDGNMLREHPHVPSATTLAFSFPNARLLRFRFASTELHLTLTVPPSLETLSVVAKRLVLSCKSTAPLALDHLSLYGQEQLVISSLRLASAGVVYLDGPANDQEGFSWAEWLDIIAPTVEVLIDYPALALYCVVDRSFYWERKGVPVSNGPLEHVRRAKSGVWDDEEEEKRPKKVWEKMHSVNRKLVEGYCAEDDQVYVLQFQ